MTYQVYQVPCRKCGNIFSSMSTASDYCAICHNSEFPSYNSSQSHSTSASSSDNSSASLGIWISGFITSAIVWACGLTVHPIMALLGLWGMKIFALPLYALLLVTSVFYGIVAGGDFSLVTNLNNFYWFGNI